MFAATPITFARRFATSMDPGKCNDQRDAPKHSFPQAAFASLFK